MRRTAIAMLALAACAEASDLELVIDVPELPGSTLLHHAAITLDGPEHARLVEGPEDPIVVSLPSLAHGDYTLAVDLFGSGTPTDDCPAVDDRINYGEVRAEVIHDGTGRFELAPSPVELVCFPTLTFVVTLLRNSAPAACSTLFPDASEIVVNATPTDRPELGITQNLACSGDQVVIVLPATAYEITVEISKATGEVCASKVFTVDGASGSGTWIPQRDSTACPPP